MASTKKPKKHPGKRSNVPKKLNKRTMKKMHLTRFEEHLEQEYGKRGTPRREEYEKGFETFMLGAMIAQAREKKGLTQEKLAKRSGTDKSYISKLENDLKDIRFSTLQKIIKDGLGATLKISIKF